MQHYGYSAFGKLVGVRDGAGVDIAGIPVVAPHFTFTGREYDSESGLYNYRARYYDARIGRFLQVDPFAGALSIPISLNSKYIYANNSPSNFTDPLGAFSIRRSLGFAFAALTSSYTFLIANTTDLYTNTFDFSQTDLNNYNSIAIQANIVVAASLSGGAAGVAVGGGFGGLFAGAAAGGAAGGLTGGGLTSLTGGTFADGFKRGFKTGVVTGGINGFLAPSSTSRGIGSTRTGTEGTGIGLGGAGGPKVGSSINTFFNLMTRLILLPFRGGRLILSTGGNGTAPVPQN